MNHIISHIEYLIMRHDCVVVPGWGAFFAHRVSAAYDSESHCFIAPRRELSFNPDIAHADGLLASSISRKERISFEQATVVVAREVEAMRSQLQSDGELSLGRLGRFIAQEGASPLFEVSARIERSMNSMFPSLEIKSIAEQVREAKKAEESAVPQNGRKRMKRFGLKAVKVAASIVVALGVGVGLLAPIVGGRDDKMAAVSATTATFATNSQTSMVAPVNNSLELLISVPVDKSAVEESSAEKDYVETESVEDAVTAVADNVMLKSESSVEVAETAYFAAEVNNSNAVALNSKTDESTLRCNSSDPYCLVVASFPIREGAVQFIDETEGNFSILEQDGKFRVYVATGKTSASTIALREGDIATRFPDAWVCRRK